MALNFQPKQGMGKGGLRTGFLWESVNCPFLLRVGLTQTSVSAIKICPTFSHVQAENVTMCFVSPWEHSLLIVSCITQNSNALLLYFFPFAWNHRLAPNWQKLCLLLTINHFTLGEYRCILPSFNSISIQQEALPMLCGKWGTGSTVHAKKWTMRKLWQRQALLFMLTSELYERSGTGTMYMLGSQLYGRWGKGTTLNVNKWAWKWDTTSTFHAN